MSEVGYTGHILHRYLKELSVKISYGRIEKLLNTPMGNSIRGMSDALDELKITHEVYQLPAEYLGQIESPFIAVLNNGHYCIIKNTAGTSYDLISDKGKHFHPSKEEFTTTWEGTILVAETRDIPYQEPYYEIKSIFDYIKSYKGFIALGISLIYLLVSTPLSATFVFNIFTWIGLIIAICIFYKESYNKSFLQSFCKIGEIIDCNSILHSKGATFGGIISLGEMALLYYMILFFYISTHTVHPYGVLSFLTCLALSFTIYSIIYQAFIARKICLLCTLLNITIWAQAVTLYLSKKISFQLDKREIAIFMIIGLLCCIGWHSLKKLLLSAQENSRLKKKRQQLLAYPGLLNTLLQAETLMVPAEQYITIHKDEPKGNKVQIIVNPHCGHCARSHKEWMKINSPLSLIFTVSPNDNQSKEVALAVIACYLKGGFQKAMDLLDYWFENKELTYIRQYPINEKVEQIFEAQQRYCKAIQLKHTPFITINRKTMPQIYDIEDLHFVQ